MSGYPLETVGDLWDEAISQFPRKPALITSERAWTYEQANEVIDRLRVGLAEQFGLQPGETVALCLPNCGAYFFAYWAIVRSGAIAVPINTRLGPAEMLHLLKSSDARILFLHRQTRGVVEKSAAEVESIRHRVTVDYRDGDHVAWEDLLASQSTDTPPPQRQGDDTVIVMHTSGTTGVPKGAIMRHRDILFNIKLAIFAHSLRHEDVHMLVVPMFHATALYSLLPAAAYQGSTICVADRPDVSHVVALIERHRATTLMGVPTFFHFFAGSPLTRRHDLSSLRVIGYAGSVMPRRTIENLRELFPRALLHNFYGMTETIAMTHVLPSADALERAESIGKPLPQIRQKIIRDDGSECAPNEVGELCLHRSAIICGYWKQPDLLNASLVDDYFRTGDLAAVDPQGYVYLKGRRKEMIIVGGENVYAPEVEAALLQHDAVREASVIGVPATGVRAWMGELIHAFVVLHEDADVRENDLRRHCAERLASYKVPQFVVIRSELPRTPTGKVRKELLREESRS